MTLAISPEAAQEAADATQYYEEMEAGLGVRFRLEFESAAATILAQPQLWRERRGGFRRANLRGFPFFVAFVVRGACVRIIAVGHGARRPGYFAARVRRPPAL